MTLSNFISPPCGFKSPPGGFTSPPGGPGRPWAAGQGLRHLGHFLHGGGWRLNVVSGSPRGGQQEGKKRNTSPTPDDPKGSADIFN